MGEKNDTEEESKKTELIGAAKKGMRIMHEEKEGRRKKQMKVMRNETEINERKEIYTQ